MEVREFVGPFPSEWLGGPPDLQLVLEVRRSHPSDPVVGPPCRRLGSWTVPERQCGWPEESDNTQTPQTSRLSESVQALA